MTVTIKDVAREAKVSVASVSRALNGSASVTEPTRQRILRVAARLRYVPHGAARSLITRRTNTIGALLPDLYGEFFSELIRGISLAARVRGLNLLVSSSHGNLPEAAAALRAMRGRVDGLLIMSPHVDAEFLGHQLPEGLPAVLLNSPVADRRYPAFNIDNYGGALTMTRHLLGLGYRSLAFLTGPAGNFDAEERLRGFRAALRMSRRRLRHWLLPGDFSDGAGYLAGRRLLTMRPRPRAVFAANDMMAIGCLVALAEAGLRVPEDVAVVGFDDIPIARFVQPPLTTVRVQIAELGRRAFEQLARRMDLPQIPDADVDVQPPCTIVVRGSCGAAAASVPRRHESPNPRNKTGGKP
jgi:LacI family transcriptional regulator